MDLIFEISTPYLESELFDLTFVQSADVMTICHKNHPPADLERLANDIWNLTDVEFADETNTPDGITVTVNTAGSETRDYTVTAIDEDGKESLTGFSNTTVTITDTKGNTSKKTVQVKVSYCFV